MKYAVCPQMEPGLPETAGETTGEMGDTFISLKKINPTIILLRQKRLPVQSIKIITFMMVPAL